MANGRLEAKISVPTGVTVSATDSGGGPTSVGVTSGDYYIGELITHLETQLNAAMVRTWTVTVDDGESGTGKVTIDTDSGTWALDWTSTALRDVLGYTGNLLSGGIGPAITSTYSVMGMWLPDCPLYMTDHQLVGHRVSDKRQSISPTGAVTSLIGNQYRKHGPVRWSHVSRERAIDASSASQVTPMTWQRFIYQTQMAGYAWFRVGSKIRIYTDADADTLLGPYSIIGASDNKIDPVVDGWTGLWRCELAEVIETS